MKMKAKKILIAAGMALLMAGFAAGAPKKDTTPAMPTITELDLARFEGKWFELSRIPIPIARDWVNTSDIYIRNPDGTWSVRYEGNKGSDGGKRKVLKQSLRIRDPSKPGDMEVSFIPFIWSKYRLIYLSEDYRFMLVGSSSMDLLWLMSREAKPAEEEYKALEAQAASLGYDVSRLERVSQSGK